MKPVSFLHGKPHFIWEEDEVNQMIINENLQFAVIEIFSYGWHDFQELKRIILKQCDLREECTIGLLNSSHILIRASDMEHYVNLLSKLAFYVSHKH